MCESQWKIMLSSSVIFWTTHLYTVLVGVYAAPRVTGNSYFHTCRYRAKEWDFCVQNVAQELRPRLVDGIPELGVGPIDPLHVPFLNFSEEGMKFRFQLQMTNVTMEGLRNYIVTGVRSNLHELRLELRLRVPWLRFRSLYHADGSFLFVSLTGSGICQYNFTDVDSKIVINGHIFRRLSDDALHVRIASLRWTMLPGSGSLHFSNLFSGNTLLDLEANRLLNQHWEEVWSSFKDSAEISLSEVFREHLDRLVSTVPYRELFPPGILPLHLLEEPQDDLYAPMPVYTAVPVTSVSQQSVTHIPISSTLVEPSVLHTKVTQMDEHDSLDIHLPSNFTLKHTKPSLQDGDKDSGLVYSPPIRQNTSYDHQSIGGDVSLPAATDQYLGHALISSTSPIPDSVTEWRPGEGLSSNETFPSATSFTTSEPSGRFFVLQEESTESRIPTREGSETPLNEEDVTEINIVETETDETAKKVHTTTTFVQSIEEQSKLLSNETSVVNPTDSSSQDRIVKLDHILEELPLVFAEVVKDLIENDYEGSLDSFPEITSKEDTSSIDNRGVTPPSWHGSESTAL